MGSHIVSEVRVKPRAQSEQVRPPTEPEQDQQRDRDWHMHHITHDMRVT